MSSPPQPVTCTQVGGQAVIEGVMMRSPNSFAVACRAPDGKIIVRESPWEPISNKLRFLKVPFLRGGLILAESLHNGMSALSFSANVASGEPEQDSPTQAPHGDPGDGQAPDALAGDGTGTGTKVAIGLTMVFSLFFAFALFKGLPHVIALGIGKLFNIAMDEGRAFIFHVTDGLVKLAIFMAYLILISKMGEIKRVFRYHGAEHKTIFAHEAGALHQPADAARFSLYHPRCGTAFLLIVILVSLLIHIMVFPFMPTISDTKWVNQGAYLLIKLLLLFPIAGIAYEIIRFSGKRQNNPLMKAVIWPGLAMQRLTVLEPSPDMLEVATAALKKVLWREAVGTAGGEGGDADNGQGKVTYEEFANIQEALAAYTIPGETPTDHSHQPAGPDPEAVHTTPAVTTPDH